MRKIVLLALLLTLVVSGAAFAQSATPVFCGDLSDADCAILTKAQDAMKSSIQRLSPWTATLS